VRPANRIAIVCVIIGVMSSRLRAHSWVGITLAGVVVATGVWVGLTPKVAMASDAAAMPVTRSAHVAYGGCPAHAVLLRVTVTHRDFAPGQQVTYRVRLTNQGGKPCGPGLIARTGQTTTSSGGAASARPVLLLGPCGAISVVIDNARGTDVSPGPISYDCPAFVGPRLRAGQTVSANGVWSRELGGGIPGRPRPEAPAGTYHLVASGKVSVPFVLLSQID
jgi:hypothetical protein